MILYTSGRLRIAFVCFCTTRFEQLFRVEVHSASVAEASVTAVSSENVVVANSAPGFERSLQSAWTGGRVTLVTSGPLDYEDVSDWRVVVRVSDEKVIASSNGTKRQSDAAIVTIDVCDVNEPPRFVSPRRIGERIDVPCTQLSGNRLYSFRTEDADIASTVITYTLVNATSVPAVQSDATSSDVRAHFRVDATSGALNVARQLQCFDCEQTISLTIRASDGELNATTSLTIVVRRTANMNFLLLIVGLTLIITVVHVAIATVVYFWVRPRRVGMWSSRSDLLARHLKRMEKASNGSKATNKGN